MNQLPAVRITHDGKVFIGEDEVPGVIAENGISIQPNVDGTGFNRMMVEFIVGRIAVDDNL